MGGYGSGRHYRWDETTKLEETQRLDVRYLHRRGLLRTTAWFDFTWHRGEQRTGAIEIQVQPGGSLLLRYVIRSGGDPQYIERRVEVEWTRCHYGGMRPWFVCPGCQRRVAVLACLHGAFRCRHCHHLRYASQSQEALDRLYHKQQQIRTRLGLAPHASMWRSPKPKGMHWKTFDRLREQGLGLENARELLIEERLFREIRPGMREVLERALAP